MSFMEGRGHNNGRSDREVEFPNTDIEARVNERLPDQAPARCQNCTISEPELAPGHQFMVCSRCRSKLDFIVHYCSKYVSRACQFFAAP
jgi:hypothetical protein